MIHIVMGKMAIKFCLSIQTFTFYNCFIYNPLKYRIFTAHR
jgi:hypothetical protein